MSFKQNQKTSAISGYEPELATTRWALWRLHLNEKSGLHITLNEYNKNIETGPQHMETIWEIFQIELQF